MKMLKTALAVSTLAATAQADAGVLQVTNLVGQMDGMNVVGATADPTLTVSPTNPTFSQLGNFELTYTGNNIGDADFAFTGIKGTWEFVSYQTAIDAGIGGKATTVATRSIYDIGTAGTVTWDAATKTLTLGQMLKYTDAKDSAMGGRTGTLTQSFVNQNSDAVAKWNSSGVGASCTPPTGTVCQGQRDFFLAKPDLEKFYLTLTFSAPGKVTGSAIGIDVGGKLPLGETGVQLSKYSFSGDVPVPAAAWLFGSALACLVTTRRHRAH